MNTCSAGSSGARFAGLIALVLSASLVAALTALLVATKYSEAQDSQSIALGRQRLVLAP